MSLAARTEETTLPAFAAGLRGRFRIQAPLAPRTWFQVGGDAEYLFTPEDEADLVSFLKRKPDDLPVTVLGVGSNLLVRDGGIDGVVLRLGRGFATIEATGENRIRAGAGALDVNVAQVAQENGAAGLEFLSGIPGTIGGALAMNGGAYGEETENILVSATFIEWSGEVHRDLRPEEIGYAYRHCGKFGRGVFTEAVFQGRPDDRESIAARMEKIALDRADSQPVRARTGSSTFTNPPGEKAWQLIDQAGCRGLTRGQAQVSQKHCNFLLNLGSATAADLEALGEEVREKVKATSGIELAWEIQRIGKKATHS